MGELFQESSILEVYLRSFYYILISLVLALLSISMALYPDGDGLSLFLGVVSFSILVISFVIMRRDLITNSVGES